MYYLQIIWVYTTFGMLVSVGKAKARAKTQKTEWKFWLIWNELNDANQSRMDFLKRAIRIIRGKFC